MIQLSLETPSQTHPEVCFTNLLGVYQSNQINKQNSPILIPNKFGISFFGYIYVIYILKHGSLIIIHYP
jgi:hypothetical protein